MERATDIPIYDCGMRITCGRDGVWLHFSSESGVSASLNVLNMASLENGGVIGRGLLNWCEDRQKQAEQIRADNSQFGVGA